MTRHSYRMVMTALLVAGLLAPLSAQRVAKRIFVRAEDAAGRPELDLSAKDFQVTENDMKREVTRATLSTAPMRVVLMVDSSTAMGPMINNFRVALNTFVDTLPEEHEIAFVSSGGQLRIRTQPSADRGKLRTEIARFAAEGGANAFLDTLIEADQRLLKPVPAQWPVLVLVTTDYGEQRRDPDLQRYNRFMNDFVARGGNAHAVVINGKQIGLVTDLAQNLIQNTVGMYQAIIVDTALPERMKFVAERIAMDYDKMTNWYELEFTGDAKLTTPTVNVNVSRDGVRVEMSPRRPFSDF
jgi:hypothetical protein